jgi:hydroxymethylbilane synthase
VTATSGGQDPELKQMPLLKIGTRGSPLALWQANETAAQLRKAHGWADDAVVLEIIKTSGDMIQDRPLSQAGGKGLFTKEIDIALLEGRIDLAVHSAKDMPTRFPDGIVIAAYLEREDVRDALIARDAKTLLELRPNAIVGTASLRRQALVKRLRPDIETTLLRGNVETRLSKVEKGELDATLLAGAGLKRLGFAHRAAGLIPLEQFPPAIGQGAIAITCRTDDQKTLATLAKINHATTATALAAERAFLTVLDGSCRTPIAGHATLEGDTLNFHGLVLRTDGTEVFEVRRQGHATQAASLGHDAGEELAKTLPAGILGH